MTDPGLVFNVLGAAFGKVTIHGTFTVTCTKISATQFTADSVSYQGYFEDLYDFNFRANNYSISGSGVQAGYATLATTARPSGRVFKDRVEFENTGKTLGTTYTLGP